MASGRLKECYRRSSTVSTPVHGHNARVRKASVIWTENKSVAVPVLHRFTGGIGLRRPHPYLLLAGIHLLRSITADYISIYQSHNGMEAFLYGTITAHARGVRMWRWDYAKGAHNPLSIADWYSWST